MIKKRTSFLSCIYFLARFRLIVRAAEVVEEKKLLGAQHVKCKKIQRRTNGPANMYTYVLENTEYRYTIESEAGEHARAYVACATHALHALSRADIEYAIYFYVSPRHLALSFLHTPPL